MDMLRLFRIWLRFREDILILRIRFLQGIDMIYIYIFFNLNVPIRGQMGLFSEKAAVKIGLESFRIMIKRKLCTIYAFTDRRTKTLVND